VDGQVNIEISLWSVDGQVNIEISLWTVKLRYRKSIALHMKRFSLISLANTLQTGERGRACRRAVLLIVFSYSPMMSLTRSPLARLSSAVC